MYSLVEFSIKLFRKMKTHTRKYRKMMVLWQMKKKMEKLFTFHDTSVQRGFDGCRPSK